MRRPQRRLLAQQRLYPLRVREQLEAVAKGGKAGRVGDRAGPVGVVGGDRALALAVARAGSLGVVRSPTLRAAARAAARHPRGSLLEQRADRHVGLRDGALEVLEDDGAQLEQPRRLEVLPQTRRLGGERLPRLCEVGRLGCAAHLLDLLLGGLAHNLRVLAQLARELLEALGELSPEAHQQAEERALGREQRILPTKEVARRWAQREAARDCEES